MRIDAMPLVAVLMLFVAGCSKSESFDLGEVKDSTYHNQFFGLTVSLPQDWNVTLGEKTDFTKKFAAGQEVTLFHAAPLKTKKPNITSVAMYVGPGSPIKTGADFLVESKKEMPPILSIRRDVTSELIAGKSFGVMEVDHKDFPTEHQRQVVTVLNGYVLLFTGTSTDEEAKTFDQVLQSMKFEK